MTDAPIFRIHDRRRAGAVRYVGVAGRVYHALCKYRLATCLALDDDPGDRVAVHHRRDEQAMQHRADAGFLYE